MRTSTLLVLSLIGTLPTATFAASPSAFFDTGFDTSSAALLKSAPPASAYPNAGAITLRDESVERINADGTDTATTYETIKIFNQRGRSYADVSIPYNASTQSIMGLHARTILPNGKVLIVPPDQIHESSPYSDYTMYDDAKSEGLSMPGIEDGAIIDYTYTTVTRKALLPGQFAANWYFQSGQDPVKLSRFTLTTPAGWSFKSQAHSAPGLSHTEKTSSDGKLKTETWEMRDQSDITPEAMMPPLQTLMPWLEISTLPSWQTIARWYQTLATPRMVASPEIKATVKELTAGKTSDTEKAKALFYWVEGKTRYVALELGQSAYQPHAAAEVCQNRYGDCKDMATLLITMLHEAGIKTAWPVLLGAGNKVPVHDYLASAGTFDHAIVRADIDGKPYWFDSTAELCTFGEIPGSDRGVDAFVIRDGVGSFETIPVGTPDDNLMKIATHVVLQPDGSADCTTTTSSDGDAALGTRFGFRSVKPDQIKEGFRSMVSSMSPNATLTDFKLSSIEDRDSPVNFSCTYHAPLWATKTGKLLIISTSNADSSKVFAHPDRHFPLYESQSGKVVNDTVITLPADYAIEEKPDDIHEKTAFGTIDTTYQLVGNTLTVHSESSRVAGMVPASDYPKLQTENEKLVELLKEPIVLHKIAK